MLKKARGLAELTKTDISTDDERPQSVVSDHKHDLQAVDWIQVQAIELVNDGTGLGFGIIGTKNSGVIVKTILPGGVAERDGRLLSGDHILQIGDVNLHEMVSEQVASVLRQSGIHVRLVVARPVDPMHAAEDVEGSAIVPSRLVQDPFELKRYLADAGYPEIFGNSTPSTPSVVELDLPETERFKVELRKDSNGLGITIAGYVCEKEELSGIFVKSVSPGSAADLSGKIHVNDRIIEVDGQSLQGFSNHQAVDVLKQSGAVVQLCVERYLRGPKYEQLQQAILANEMKPSTPNTPPRIPKTTKHTADDMETSFSHERLPTKKAIEPPAPILTTFGSQSSRKKLIHARDSIETKMSNASTAILAADEAPESAVDEEEDDDEEEDEFSVTNPFGGSYRAPPPPNFGNTPIASTPEVESTLTEDIRLAIVSKWTAILGTDVDIIVAQIRKFGASSGLGISLEGTVDVEGGKEVRPHHYIRSILPEGPVGQNGLLQSGDELLEVNGHRLLGMNHLEVVSILKELPQNVRMVCSRNVISSDGSVMIPFTKDNVQQALDVEFDSESGSTQSLMPQDRLVKAKSDGSLATTGSPVGGTGVDGFTTKMKSRSLEPLTGLAMWSSQPQIIELVKGERGLGFSILDYQDPLDPNDTLIVIRSLVPGGVAQLDGRLIPGDRLLFVNEINLENASLDQAVQALKGAAKGVVRIGVAKPLPMHDSSLSSYGGDSSRDSGAFNFNNSHGGSGSGTGGGGSFHIGGPKPDVIGE